MADQEIERKKHQIIQHYDVWTAHNIRLSHNLFTMDQTISSDKLKRIVQIVSDVAKKPFGKMRILDLACLEGGYAIEFAARGARVVAIEGRETNIQKAIFSKKILQLDGIDFIHDDVRNLSKCRYGTFDVVLCLGILYHLDAPDVFNFINKISDVCEGIAIFDTYFSLTAKENYHHNGHIYSGRRIWEHGTNDTELEKLNKLWSSIGNDSSVWLTKATLINLLLQLHFTSLYECHAPLELCKPLDRITLVAVKGVEAGLVTSIYSDAAVAQELPEKLRRRASHHQRPIAIASKRINSLIPRSLRSAGKKILRQLGLVEPPAAGEKSSRFRW